MTLTQIRYFVAVAGQMSFTKAAGQMFVAQQVISKQIKRLEEEVGFALFERRNGKIALSEGGELLYPFWKRMLEEQNDVIVRASDVMKKKSQLIRIGTMDVSRIYDWIAAGVSAVSARNLGWRFMVESDSFRNLYQKLVEGRYDCIISLQDENGNLPEEYEEQILCRIFPRLVIADTHPSYYAGMSVRELKDSILYVLSPRFSRNASQNIIQYCKNIGFTPSQVESYDEINSLEMALHAGNGFTLMYEPFFRNPIGCLKFLDLEKGIHDTENSLCITYARSKKRQLQPFLESLRGIQI